MAFLNNLFSRNAAAVSKLQKQVQKINALEEKYAAMSGDELAQQVSSWRAELKDLDDEEQKARLTELLPDSFAVTREVTKRLTNRRHFDVQLMGAIVLHNGQIAEMRTGEGKTQTAVLALALNALTGRGAHLVTVNDYLARWHASLMGPIYHALGLSVSSIQHQKSFLYDPSYEPETSEIERLEAETEGFVMDVKHMRPCSRREAYQADITYGTNNEFGFDYLRDNMVPAVENLVQRELYFAIVDEVDSILIDEARTPLIISAPDTDPTDKYVKFARLVQKLQDGEDFTGDDKKKSIALSEAGIEKIEAELGIKNIYEEGGIITVHHIEQALRARRHFLLDRDYVIRNSEVVIVDEFTGRLMFGRRYSDGLHQAIEAKEGVKIQQESKTLATITFQNYFRLYEKLSGMTGTAMTEQEEFYKIYGLEVVAIPTHRPMVRKDQSDLVYKSEKGKFAAIVKDVKARHALGQPVLIGTVSIAKNEILAEELKKAGVPFELLNAKNHEREAHIISQAGRLGAVTVATNIAGRGVDILLGGNPVDHEEAAKVRELGGLHILGTERHESRRIDNQLRGRAGRQGDPGSSQFYVSVEDDLMRLFGGSRLKSVMESLGIEEDQPIEHSMVSRSIEQAQKKIEGLHFDSRKQVLEYDDIMNRQREVIYKKRRAWIAPDANLRDEIMAMVKAEVANVVEEYYASETSEPKDLVEKLNTIFPVSPEAAAKMTEFSEQAGDEIFATVDFAQKLAEDLYVQKEKFTAAQSAEMQQPANVSSTFGQARTDDFAMVRQLERIVALQNLDTIWMEHLDTMEHLRESVGLRGYGQRDPLVEYKREGFDLFKRSLAEIDKGIAYAIYKVGIMSQPQATQAQQVALAAAGEQQVAEVRALSVDGKEPGRNDACPCGSGKKYKKCGMLNTPEHQANMAKK
jgi:preprotein translocase subunit SecA